jgi:hypothetical protein
MRLSVKFNFIFSVSYLENMAADDAISFKLATCNNPNFWEIKK